MSLQSGESPARCRAIVGTAGHVDHGKTRLVQALTGIDCDRLAEEKARGITIDLGFAHLLAADVQLGFIDVPGHQRFLDNALAGFGGVRILLLVVAATEGVMPQTREHVAVASLLEIPAAVVALTKIDLAEPDLVELARADVQDLLVSTGYAGAKILPVSAVTGHGVGELKRELLALARRHHVEADLTAPARLPVDRAFHLLGRGTVVTGTLASGMVRRGESLHALRLGKEFRVRSIEVHVQDRELALAGERTSLLLAGAELEEMERGRQLVSAEAYSVSARWCGELHWLAGAPRDLEGWQEVRVHLLAGEAMGRIRALEPGRIEPGQKGFAEIRLHEPLVVARGDRFILRRPTPAATLGGGSILDPCWQTRRGQVLSGDLLRLCAGRESRLLLWIERAGARGASGQELARRKGVEPAKLNECLNALVEGGQIHPIGADRGGPTRFLAVSVLRQLEERARVHLTQHFEANRFSPGLCKGEMLHQLCRGLDGPDADRILGTLLESGTLALSEGKVTLPDHQPALSAEEEAAMASLLADYEAGGLEPPASSEIASRIGVPPEVALGLAGLLVARRQLLRLPNHELIAAASVEALRAELLARGWERVTVQLLKEHFGLTRRWSLPLLELCDSLGLTRRLGMDRLVIRDDSPREEGQLPARDPRTFLAHQDQT